MPAQSISIYFNDEQFVQYLKKKEEYNKLGRGAVLKQITKDLYPGVKK